jgi:hypothetical protein
LSKLPFTFTDIIPFQDTDEQYKIDTNDAIATAANLTDLQKMQAELFDVKFPIIQPSLDLACKNCSIVSHSFGLQCSSCCC